MANEDNELYLVRFKTGEIPGENAGLNALGNKANGTIYFATKKYDSIDTDDELTVGQIVYDDPTTGERVIMSTHAQLTDCVTTVEDNINEIYLGGTPLEPLSDLMTGNQKTSLIYTSKSSFLNGTIFSDNGLEIGPAVAQAGSPESIHGNVDYTSQYFSVKSSEIRMGNDLLVGNLTTNNRSITISEPLFLEKNTASTSIDSGTLIVTGGIGVSDQVTSTRIGVNGSNTSYNLYVNGTTGLEGNIVPITTNTYELGSTNLRWKKVYIGTSDTYGSSSLPIYWNNGVPIACTASDLFSSFSSSVNTLSATIAGQPRAVNIINSINNNLTPGTSTGPTLVTSVNGVNSSSITIPLNSSTTSGVIPAPTINDSNKVWQTNENGVPGWATIEIGAPIVENVKLLATNWDAINKTYTIYSNNVTTDSYQIISMPNDTLASSDEFIAYSKAMIVDAGQNTGVFTIKALGDIPTIDIDVRIIYQYSTDNQLTSMASAASSAAAAQAAVERISSFANIKNRIITVPIISLSNSNDIIFPYEYIINWNGVAENDWVDGFCDLTQHWAIESSSNKIILHFSEPITSSFQMILYWTSCSSYA